MRDGEELDFRGLYFSIIYANEPLSLASAFREAIPYTIAVVAHPRDHDRGYNFGFGHATDRTFVIANYATVLNPRDNLLSFSRFALSDEV